MVYGDVTDKKRKMKTVRTWRELAIRNKELSKNQHELGIGYFLIITGGFLQNVSRLA